MKIAIIGTRGIPNNYGGFEQFAEYLSVSLAERGHEITVYSPHFHPYRENAYKGVTLKHIYSPEKHLGSMANFIYDWLSLKDATKQDFDIIYEAGYQSSAISIKRFSKNASQVIITNMDGIEWKRSKWNKVVKRFTKRFERIALKYSNYIISDNKGIQDYYKNCHNTNSFYLAYGANVINEFDESVLSIYSVTKYNYFLLIARLEPENNIENILLGYELSNTDIPLLVVGNYNTRYGEYLKDRFPIGTIKFVGGIYKKNDLDTLRHYAKAYFHGHSVGGTNPSLLEAMAAGAFIISHENEFNKSVLENSALYFSTPDDIKKIILALDEYSINLQSFRIDNRTKVAEEYNWLKIIDEHENLFLKLIAKKNENNINYTV